MHPAPDEFQILLAEVKARPDDDTPRLVLADWLQDRGDPRGEFLALDLQRHRLSADDPGITLLWERQRRLLARFAFDWLGSLVDLASHWTFHRGFLQVTARAEHFLTDALDELARDGRLMWVERPGISRWI